MGNRSDVLTMADAVDLFLPFSSGSETNGVAQRRERDVDNSKEGRDFKA